MKRIFLLSMLFAAYSTLFAAQSSYAVYEFRGDVLCKKSGEKTWTPVVKNMQLGILDSVYIAEGDYLRIRDEKADGVYRSVSAGKMRVMDLVVQARKQSRQRVEMQVNDNIRRTMNQEQPSMNVYGTGTRAKEEYEEKPESGPLDKILAAALIDSLPPMQTDLMLRKVVFGQAISFVIDNPTPLGYYVNVLHIDRETQVMTYCYSFNEDRDAALFYIYPGASVTFHDAWFPNTPNDIYILIASPEALPMGRLGENCIYLKAE